MLRAEGEMGCAHCAQMGADRPCQICTHMICATCAADWTTCSEPSGRVVRLGFTARVRDIDPTGHLALVTKLLQPMRVLDLRTLRYVALLPFEVSQFRRRFAPRLLSTPHVIYAEYSTFDETLLFEGLRKYPIGGHRAENLDSPTKDPPQRSSAVSATGDVLSYVGSEERVHVFGAGLAGGVFDPLPRKVIQATCVDGERSLLASASWSEIALDRIAGGRLERLGYTKTALPGDVRWVGIAGPFLAAAVSVGSSGTHVEIHRIGDDLSIGPVVRSFDPTWGFRTAALSHDGRYLAAAYTARLEVLNLETGANTTFEDHSDTINMVRFGTDHVLVSADTDNRVVLRPRAPTGYARTVIAATVAD